MSDPLFLSSLTRITDLRSRPFERLGLERERWGEGDYVLARVRGRPRGFNAVELDTGRMAEVDRGALIAGALGVRHATLEAVGTWEKVGSDGRMACLTSAGLFGKLTSLSSSLPPLLELEYVAHLARDGQSLKMADFAAHPEEQPYACPTVLIVGTSMSAGKTTSARVIIRALRSRGLRVVGAKLTGAGRYRDILAMSDAGAEHVFDFVDVGLPSSILPPEEFRPALRDLLSLIAAAKADVVVAEAGASPLEPYNGESVLQEIQGRVSCIVLCASDPYAVAGVTQAFDLRPDLVAGLATSTSAGIELVEKLTGFRALNLLAQEDRPALDALLGESLGV